MRNELAATNRSARFPDHDAASFIRPAAIRHARATVVVVLRSVVAHAIGSAGDPGSPRPVNGVIVIE
jgi:hypothetical protein